MAQENSEFTVRKKDLLIKDSLLDEQNKYSYGHLNANTSCIPFNTSQPPDIRDDVELMIQSEATITDRTWSMTFVLLTHNAQAAPETVNSTATGDRYHCFLPPVH